MHKEDNSKPASVAFLAGLLTGGIVATLYAPKSGKATRNEIKYKANKAQEDLKNTKDEMQDKVKRGYQEMKSSAKDYASDMDIER